MKMLQGLISLVSGTASVILKHVNGALHIKNSTDTGFVEIQAQTFKGGTGTEVAYVTDLKLENLEEIQDILIEAGFLARNSLGEWTFLDFQGTYSGTITIKTTDWSANQYSAIIDNLADESIITFELQTDSLNLPIINAVSQSGNTVVFQCNAVPSVDVVLNYTITDNISGLIDVLGNIRDSLSAINEGVS